MIVGDVIVPAILPDILPDMTLMAGTLTCWHADMLT
jgi:hypothetical protein